MRKIDKLPFEIKMLICDNCEHSDTCEKAYTGLFMKKTCFEIYKTVIKEELYPDD